MPRGSPNVSFVMRDNLCDTMIRSESYRPIQDSARYPKGGPFSEAEWGFLRDPLFRTVEGHIHEKSSRLPCGCFWLRKTDQPPSNMRSC